MAERSAVIDGFDPDLIPGFEIDQIRPDAIPEKVINAVRLAQADGEKFIGSNYVNKRITVLGHFYAATRGDYEVARDTLLGLFDPDQIVSLSFEQSKEMRRYSGSYENVMFDYKDNGFCMVTITYRCTDPFGYTVAESTFLQQNAVTAEITRTFDTGGNVYGLAKIVATITSIDNTTLPRTFNFTVSQGARSYNVQITRVWAVNDSLKIDTANGKVYVNGSQVEFVGRLPQLLKTNTFRFGVPDAASFNVNLLGTYNKRWL
jgi:hypothetical protein